MVRLQAVDLNPERNIKKKEASPLGTSDELVTFLQEKELVCFKDEKIVL